MDVDDDETATINTLLEDMQTEPSSAERIIGNEHMTSLQSKLMNEMNIFIENGPTVALWVQ